MKKHSHIYLAAITACFFILPASLKALPSNSALPAGTLSPGQQVPDFVLTDQNSHQVHFKNFRGKIVLVTFLYTSCPYPEKCPMLAQKLNETRKLINNLANGKNRFQAISITLDPVRDTPQRLRSYIKQHGCSTTENWTFLTGKPEEVSRVAGLFGVIYWTDKGIVQHNMSTAIIDPQGKLYKIFTGSDWKSGEVASTIKRLLEQ